MWKPSTFGVPKFLNSTSRTFVEYSHSQKEGKNVDLTPAWFTNSKNTKKNSTIYLLHIADRPILFSAVIYHWYIIEFNRLQPNTPTFLSDMFYTNGTHT